MSQINYDPISLEQLVGYSTDILLVTAANPPMSRVSVPVGNDPVKCPPYQKTLYRFEIVEALLTSCDTPTTGPIQVDEAYCGAQLDLHRAYYLEGISESPIYSIYTPSAPPSAERSIIFLLETETGFEFAAEGAQEAESMKERIRAILKDKAP